MSKILKSVIEIQKEDKDFLRFEYLDNSSNQDFIIHGKTINHPQRNIKIEGQKYYLIDDQQQINKKLQRTYTSQFKANIFLITADFSNKVFERSDFSDVIFTKDVNFSFTKFDNQINFIRTKFISDADFSHAVFTKNAFFHKAEFFEVAYFSLTEFSQQAYFYDAIFNKDINFSSAKIYGLLNLSSRLSSTVKLNLELTTVERIFYKNRELRTDNRETYLILKNIAIKQNDQIKALEFYTQEYQIHYKNLKWNSIDKWILGFEKNVSYFGTKVGRAICWLLFLTVFSYLLIFGLLGGGSADMQDFVRFVSPISYDLNKIFTQNVVVNFWAGLSFILYKILQFVMIYEVIKSFRKFSRAL